MIAVNTYKIGSVEIADITCKELADIMAEACRGDKAILACSMNGEGVAYYNSNQEFKELIDNAEIIHADGWSTMMAGRLLTPGDFIERVATTDAYVDMLKKAEKEEFSVYFLGAKNSVLEKAVNKIKNQYPKLIVSGYRDGYFSDNELDSIIADIDASKSKIIFIGLGRPKQEKVALYLKENSTELRWIKTCGGLFDFISGEKSRAPMIMQRMGMEWVYRLALEPKRLFWRYLWTNFYSLYAYFLKR